MTIPPRWSAVAQAVVLAAIGTALVIRAATPPGAAPAGAPPTEFSAERAMVHVRAIAQRPHPTGSAEAERVRAYLVAELRRLGVEPTVQEATGIGTRYRTAGRVRNIVARIPGTDGRGRAVMLVSHYDSQGASPGAGDAASATAALLEVVRALQAGEPLANDVIVLLTDGEEAGLLGAAAFAREHPWAAHADMILNFEARGTEGRVFMFETGSGNLDAVRVLRRVPDVSATSLMVMVYRVLPNDTDLSELAVLARPAMNFAFIDGVERYHTAHDDVAHLDARSVQHHGNQALALARAFGTEPLPRPSTGDAVFFDVPWIGVVAHPESWALPIALLASVLALVAMWRVYARQRHPVRDLAIGFAATLTACAAASAGAVALALTIAWMHDAAGWGGVPEWRGIYAAAVVAWAGAVATAAWALARRWATAVGARSGALLVWGMLALAVAVAAAGASYLFAWPLLATCLAILLVQRVDHPAVVVGARLAATSVVLVMLVPLVYLLGTALGIEVAGAAAAGLLTALGVWLVAHHVESLAGPVLWRLPAGLATLAAALVVVGAVTVRPSDAYPTRANIVREIAVDAADTSALPAADIVGDTAGGDTRLVTLRVRAPAGALSVRMRTTAAVLGVEIDGRRVDTSRYRRRSPQWEMTYVAPPDTGILVALAVPRRDRVAMELTARMAGVDPPGPSREGGAHAVPTQQGDATLLRRTLRF